VGKKKAGSIGCFGWGESMPKWVRVATLVVLALLALVGVLLIVYWAVWADLSPDWTGFGPYDEEARGPRSKTLWDWLDLLIVGLVIAAGGILLNRSARNRQQAIARANRQQETLQSYYDKLADLLLDYELKKDTEKGREAQDIARARTLATLRALDSDRKGWLLKFLYESELINRDNPIVSLVSADLLGANLSEANLSEANLGGADLNGARLRGAEW
jgi:hypothetical protein